MDCSKLHNPIERLFSRAWLAAVVNMLGVAAGYLGAHFDRDIAVAWVALTANSFDVGVVTGGVWAFSAASLSFGVLFAGMAWSQQKAGERFADQIGLSSKRIEAHTADLRCSSERLEGISSAIDEKTGQLAARADLIQSGVQRLFSLPPRGFLVKYAALVNEITCSCFATRTALRLNKDMAEAAIRGQLLCVIRLARSFDQPVDDVVYGCNVMLFAGAGSLRGRDRDTLQTRLRFVERAVDIRQLSGVLMTVRELSVSGKTDEPDESLPLICLPIPMLGSEDARFGSPPGVLPGAPDAFVRRINTAIEAPDEWRDKLATTAFTEHVRSDLHRYVKEVAPTIQSFLSIPLFPPIDSPSADTSMHDVAPFGVLNVHRNTPNRLLAEKLEFLSPLLSLSVHVIAREVWLYINSNKDNRNDCDIEVTETSTRARADA